MSENRSRSTRSRFTAWWDENCGRKQPLLGSTSLSSLYASIMCDWHVSGDRMLLTLLFSIIVHRLWGKQTLVLSQNGSLNLTVTDRQKDGQRQTYGRTDVHQDTQKASRKDRKEARQTRQKQRQEAEDNRDKTGDKDGGAVWSTLRRVGGCCVVVCCSCWWCCALLFVLRACASLVGAFWVVAASLLLSWGGGCALSSLGVAAIPLL